MANKSVCEEERLATIAPMRNPLFVTRGTPTHRQKITVQFLGLIFILGLWSLISGLELASPALLPSPWAVLAAVPELHTDFALLRNIIYSLYLNFSGYIIAVIISVGVGTLTASYPFFRNFLKPYIDAARYVPINALTGLFILYLGLGSGMKIMFLAVGIIVYLMPLVVQRLDEVNPQLVDIARSLRATDGQIIRKVLLPSAMSNIFTDIRVIVAVSWTYITIVEMLNAEAGLGSLMYKAQRQTRPDWMFALLFIIIIIGFSQDRLFKILERAIFPHKENGGKHP